MFSKTAFTVNDEEIILHPQTRMLPAHHFVSPTPPDYEMNGDLSGVTNAAASETKRTAKKNRHSKINTAQGPRDRRVRLSIGIARKFFDLQEMLEFDKPSDTLDWLLTNSKTAIKELVQNKEKLGQGITSSPLECSKQVKESVERHPNSSSLAKESRAKARDRARERTKEKMCIKSLAEEHKRGANMQFSELLAGSSNSNPSFLNEDSLIRRPGFGDLIHEPGTKPKNPCFPIIQQNLAVTRDFNSNYTTSSTADWDNFASEPNVYVIFDQHKFINR